MRNKFHLTLLSGALFSVVLVAQAQQHDPNMHQQHQAGASMTDGREIVKFPEEMRIHTLSNMRDHLLALSEIQEALSKGWFDKAAGISEQRLGMTSLKLHGAHESSKYMPKGMLDIGSSMHHSASQFAIEIENSAATGDLRPALAALARTTEACVACHAAYRVQ